MNLKTFPSAETSSYKRFPFPFSYLFFKLENDYWFTITNLYFLENSRLYFICIGFLWKLEGFHPPFAKNIFILYANID